MTPGIEIVNPSANASGARVALFDFDGTLSLVRAGWEEVMIPMMVGYLAETESGESEDELTAIVADFVGRLTGRQTIYQRIELADQVRARGGRPKDPLEYKHEYLDLLMGKIHDRREGLRAGRIDPDEMILPGGRRLLESLRERGFTMFLASGTDQQFMREEAELLDVARYFDGGVFGALDDYKSFSKKILVERLIQDSAFTGGEFLGFGDGFVEIEVVKEVGGVAVGVASDEPECARVNPVKRERLIGVGADWIVPHFGAHDELMAALFSA
jgi:phosphoglycolate phosphatase